MNSKKVLTSVIALGLIGSLTIMPSSAIEATFMEGQFEETQYIGNVTGIEAWEQPKTPYTPKNLESEYQIRVNGTDKNGRGAYSYTMHFTDYDTKITGNGITSDGRYYVQDSSGKAYVTGEHIDLTPVNNQINNLGNQIYGLNSQVNNIQNQVDRNSFRINKLENRLESGLATVSALTALHPNPRSKEKLEVAIGGGMYADNVAGAIGLFYHPNDRVMLSAGAAYGGDNQFAGNFGITFGLGRRKHK